MVGVDDGLTLSYIQFRESCGKAVTVHELILMSLAQ
jgi:hypothetical protein